MTGDRESVFHARRLSQNHAREIGSSVTWSLRFGSLHMNVEAARGVYGFPNTRSYGLRVWWA